MTPQLNVTEGKIAFSLDVHCHKEDEIFVSFIPALDLVSHGNSETDAINAATEAGVIFLKELIRMGTLEDVLLELGWEKIENDDAPAGTFPFLPPHVIHKSVPLNFSCLV